MQEKVLVTGATGFLGSWVAREIVRSGREVRVLVRRPERLRALEHLNVNLEVFAGDILEPDSIDAAARGVSAIVHCAGDVSWRPRDSDRVWRVNVEGTRNVLEVAVRNRLRLVHTSSTATIGPTRQPQLLDETSPPPPKGFESAYSASKREAEEIVLARGKGGADVVVLNPGMIMGPGDAYFTSTDIVREYLRGELIYYVHGGGSYCDVRDLAAAFVRALRDGRPGERYILAGVNRSHAEMRAELQRLTGLHHSFEMPGPVAEWAALWSEVAAQYIPHPYETMNRAMVRWGSRFTFCTTTKAKDEIGYQIRDFGESLRDTIVDHLRRHVVHPVTPQLRRLLKTAPSAEN